MAQSSFQGFPKPSNKPSFSGFIKNAKDSLFKWIALVAVTIVGSAYNTSGNGGRKLVRLSNGWLVAIELNSTTIQIQKSGNFGITWAALCNITGMQAGAAVTSYGNRVTVLCNSTTVVYSVTFDALTVTNIDLNSTKVTVDTQTSLSNNVTIAADTVGNLYAAMSTKNATYPNSFNIRYSTSTDGGVTWAAVTQVTTDNTAGTDNTAPSIVLQTTTNYPVILYGKVTSTTWAILAIRYNGAAWEAAGTSPYPAAITHAQSSPCASVAPNGRIVVAWHGLDAVDTTVNNIHAKYSDDNGVTWVDFGVSGNKITSGNTLTQANATVSADAANNFYINWSGRDGAVSVSYLNLRRIIWNGSAWGAISTLTANTTNNIATPSSVDNNSLVFTDPLCLYRDDEATAVKFRGTYRVKG